MEERDDEEQEVEEERPDEAPIANEEESREPGWGGREPRDEGERDVAGWGGREP